MKREIPSLHADLARLQARETEGDLYAMTGDFGTAAKICREVSEGLRAHFGFGDAQQLRAKARETIGHWA